MPCVASTLYAIAAHDILLAIDPLGEMAIADDRLLATAHMYELLYVSLYHDERRIRPHVVRTVRASDPKTAELGGQLAALAAILERDAPPAPSVHGTNAGWCDGFDPAGGASKRQC